MTWDLRGKGGEIVVVRYERVEVPDGEDRDLFEAEVYLYAPAPRVPELVIDADNLIDFMARSDEVIYWAGSPGLIRELVNASKPGNARAARTLASALG